MELSDHLNDPHTLHSHSEIVLVVVLMFVLAVVYVYCEWITKAKKGGPRPSEHHIRDADPTADHVLFGSSVPTPGRRRPNKGAPTRELMFPV